METEEEKSALRNLTAGCGKVKVELHHFQYILQILILIRIRIRFSYSVWRMVNGEWRKMNVDEMK